MEDSDDADDSEVQTIMNPLYAHRKHLHDIDPARTDSPTGMDKSDFVFGQELGRGAVGKVCLCMEKSTGQLFAAKIMKRRRLANLHLIKYVNSECEILSGLRHPNIVRLYHTFNDDERMYMIMELVSGGELFTHIRQMESSALPAIKFYLAELCLAVEALHERGIVHRDLKPEHMLLATDGHLRLADFGLARKLQSTTARMHTFCGTADYVAPEILRDNGYGPSVDWWSFGCTLYELITGTSPFTSSNVSLTYHKILQREIFWPEEFPADARDLCDQLLNPDAKHRLGCGKNGAADVRAHPFFAGIDFTRLPLERPSFLIELAKRLPPMKFRASQLSPKSSKLLQQQQAGQQQHPGHVRYYVRGEQRAAMVRPRDVAARSAALRALYAQLRKLPERPAPLVHALPPPVQLKQPPAEEGSDSKVVSLDTAQSVTSGGTILKHVRTIQGQQTPVRVVAWDPTGEMIAASGNFSLHIHRRVQGASTLRMAPVVRLPTASSSGFVTFSPNSKYLAFDLQRHVGIAPPTSPARVSALVGHSLPITCATFTTSGERLVSGGSDRSLIMWEPTKQKLLFKLEPHKAFISCIGTTTDTSGMIVSGGGDGRLAFVDAMVGRVVQRMDHHRSGVLAVDWRPQNDVLASLALDRTLVIMDSRSWRPTRVLAHQLPVWRMSWSPDGQYIATAGQDYVRVWTFPGMQQIAALPSGDSMSVIGSSISWNKDSTMLATTGTVVSPAVFDVRTCGIVPTDKFRHSAPITSLRWSPVDDLLAVGSFDKTVSLWQLE